MAMAHIDVDTPHPATAFISALFGASSECPVFFQTLANDKADPDEGRNKKHVLTREVSAVLRFITKHNRARRGLYFCVGTLAEGSATRNKENVRETVGLHQDLDFKTIAEDEPTIRARLESLRCQPTVRVRSGGGLHLYWLFREHVATQDNLERIENALRGLAAIVGGDPAVCEVSRLMRLPGTQNSKYGDIREVVTETLDGPRYELEELEEFIAETAPILTYVMPAIKPTRPNSAAGKSAVAADPYEELANDPAFRSRIDCDAALAGMVFPGNIHDTQRDVTASLIKHGAATADVVEIVLAATRAAQGVDVARWNWKHEEKEIRGMCASARVKYGVPEPVVEPVSPEPAQQDNADRNPDADRDGGAEPQKPAPVVDLGEARSRKASEKAAAAAKPKQLKAPAAALHIKLATAVLKVMEGRGQRLMFTPQGSYHYSDNLWQLVPEPWFTRWLESTLEEGARGLSIESTIRLINEAKKYILRDQELHRNDVQFDAHGQIPTRSGLIDPRTGELTRPDPAQFVTWRIEHDYDPEASCPNWLQMIEDVFADRSEAARANVVQLLQEMCGAGLLDRKPKALSRALILVGGSDFGKSGLIDVMSGLFGPAVIAVPLASLEASVHATMPFAKRLPWTLHEAFNSSQYHLSDTTKALISGDPVQVNVKGGALFVIRYTAPIFWGSNSPPQFREATRAIANRIAIVECKRRFDPDNPLGVDALARARGHAKPQDLILAEEMPGVLTWAVAGLRRALERGYYELPDEARAAAETMQRDANMVASFFEDAIDFDPDSRVSVPDFWAAFGSHWLENKGEGSNIPSRTSMGKAVAALSNPMIAYDNQETRDRNRRYYAGIALNSEGIRMWHNAVTSEAFAFRERLSDATSPDSLPNSRIPADWDDKPAILAMRKAHAKPGSGRAGSKTAKKHGPAQNVLAEGDVLDQTQQTAPEEAQPQPIDPTRKPRF
ncbi:P4 family phage/plasmid primase-like protein [Bradyrhizobium japonicum]